jgi:aspartate dehydrogenase
MLERMMSHDTLTVAIIGFGAIGRAVADEIRKEKRGLRLTAVAVRSAQSEAAASLPRDVSIVDDPWALLALRPDLAVECAGHEALAFYAPVLLANGIDVMAASTGALAKPGVLEAWLPESGHGRGRIIVPAGAIAGLDGLGAHRIAGLEQVIYTSIKPPEAWRGTPAEEVVDLDELKQPFMFFQGSAREAALAYPKNANLAATVGLAGIGLDATLVRLIADPAADGNTGIIEASGAIGTLRVEQHGAASSNPKTSASTAYSLAHALRNVTSRLVV